MTGHNLGSGRLDQTFGRQQSV